MSKKVIMSNFTDSIINCFKEKYKDYTIGDYETADDNVKTPAIFIQLPNFENANDKIKEVFRINCTFRAYACESFKGEAKKRVRDTAVDIAKFIDGNNWGDSNAFNNASFVYAAEDEFNEKINSSEVWYVEWEQEIYY